METRTLAVKLTETELDERRDKLAEMVREYTQAEQAKKDAATHHKGIVDGIEEQMSHTAREIREKAQWIPVECRKEIDQEAGVEELIRLDTMEVVETRKLSPHERQAKLFEAKREVV